MFLSFLEANEKELFFNLAVALAKSDNVIAVSEQEIIDGYALEMQLPKVDIASFEERNLSSCLEELSNLNHEESKRAILVELLILAHIDGEFSIEEQGLIAQVVATLKVDEAIFAHLLERALEYTKSIHSITRYILKNEK